MGKYFDMLMEDVRMKEGLTACMNCGICTGVCPAAEFYNYDPRQIINTVQTKDDDAIEQPGLCHSGIATSFATVGILHLFGKGSPTVGY